MKWLLNLVCVNGLIGGLLYPLTTLGVGAPFNWLLEVGLLVSGAAALYLLVKYRKSL